MSRRKEFFGEVRVGGALTCGYDAGHDERSTCSVPATWHGWVGVPPDTRLDGAVFACEEHFKVLAGRLWDYHQTGGACGVPGAKWYNGAEMGQGCCRHDLDFDTLDVAMLEPARTRVRGLRVL